MEKEQLREIFTIGVFYLMLLTSLILVTTKINSIQDENNITTSSEVREA